MLILNQILKKELLLKISLQRISKTPQHLVDKILAFFNHPNRLRKPDPCNYCPYQSYKS